MKNIAVLSLLLSLVLSMNMFAPVTNASMEDDLIGFVAGFAVCETAEGLKRSMQMKSADSDFESVPFSYYCYEMSRKHILGNADSWDGVQLPLLTETPWHQAHGAALDVGIVSTKDNYQPYEKIIKYKEIPVNRGNGRCKLEMRVYKKDIHAGNLKPLIALHGGSFKYRGFGVFGLQAIMSQFTERGFVVFVPFYRLAGEQDGNVECNGVTHTEIKQDVLDAYTWVQVHKRNYGAQGKVSVTGHSAGGFLAQYLVTQHPTEIDRALLFYPPTDMSDFINNIGLVTEEQGISALEAFIGLPLNSIDANSDAVKSNNLTDMVARNPAIFPKTKILHGSADVLVPSRQSVRLCNALNGNVESGFAANDGGVIGIGPYEKTYQCNSRGSSLHLFAEANHIFDICIVEGEASGCLSGSDQSRAVVRRAVKQSYDWLAGRTDLEWMVPVVSLILH